MLSSLLRRRRNLWLLGVGLGYRSRSAQAAPNDWIETLGRKGSFVRERVAEPPFEVDGDLDAAAEAMVFVARQLGVTRHEALTAVGDMWDHYSG